MMAANKDFIHRFLPGREPDGPVLLLLHGTGGNEDDLIPLGQRLLPGAALLSLRGKVLENGQPRFFRRLAEGVFDLPDLKRRTDELAAFLAAFRIQHGLERNSLIAIAYSNGANIAASLLLLHPLSLSSAVLFRAMVPFEPDSRPDLNGTALFLSAGQLDPIVPAENTTRLARLFREAGADVFLHWHRGGHQLATDDIEAATSWLRGSSGSTFSAPHSRS